jgi:hypothetical protein
VLFTEKGLTVGKGDYAVSSKNSARPLSMLVQAGSVVFEGDNALSEDDKASFPEIMNAALSERKEWVTLSPENRLSNIEKERLNLKKGDFSAESDIDDFIGTDISTPGIVVRQKIIFSPVEIISDSQKSLKIKVVLDFTDPQSGSSILTKEHSLTRKISAGGICGGPVLGLEDGNLKCQYFDMDKMLLDELIKRSLQELQVNYAKTN